MGGKPLGYKIKYIDRPGYKTKYLLYEIKPGVWVPRGKVPEVLKYRERTKEHKYKIDYKYLNSERGYMRSLFASSRKNARYKNLPFKFTWEEWWEHWLNQKKKWEWKCPYTKINMTHIRGNNNKKTKTNISADRINVKHGYTPVNTIFCTWAANDSKGSISIDMCEAIIDLYKESIEENFVKKFKIKKMGYEGS